MTERKPPPGKPVQDPSGAKRPTTIHLAPRHHELLRKLSAERGISASALITKLLERLEASKDTAAAEIVRRQRKPSGCSEGQHRWEIRSGGIKVCAKCEEVKKP